MNTRLWCVYSSPRRTPAAVSSICPSGESPSLLTSTVSTAHHHQTSYVFITQWTVHRNVLAACNGLITWYQYNMKGSRSSYRNLNPSLSTGKNKYWVDTQKIYQETFSHVQINSIKVCALLKDSLREGVRLNWELTIEGFYFLPLRHK